MKKIVFLLSLIFFKAQAESRWESRVAEGNSLINASIALGYSSYAGTIVSVNPSYKYFFIDRVALGGVIEYAKSGNYNRFAVGPNLFYYLPLYDVGVAYLGDTITHVNHKEGELKLSGWLNEVSIGMIYLFSEHIGLDIGYSIYNAFDESKLEDTQESGHVVFAFFF